MTSRSATNPTPANVPVAGNSDVESASDASVCVPSAVEFRDVRYADVHAILEDVRKLRRGGCRGLGRWTLGQACYHLAVSFDGSMDGFGVSRHRVMRVLFGRRALRQIFASGRIDAGMTVTTRLDPPGDVGLEDGERRLIESVERYVSHSGSLSIHPFFGPLTREEWDRLHCIHAAHHLRRFVSPT